MTNSINRFGSIFFFLFLALFFHNCEKNEIPSTEEIEVAEDFPTIEMETASEVEYLDDDNEIRSRTSGFFTFRTLNKALRCTGLNAALFDGRNTIYAPSDAAFAKLGLNAHNVCEALDATTLSNILLYHVSAGNVRLSKQGCLEMANGDIAQLSRNRLRFLINESRIYLAFTQRTRNARLRVYVITDVLTVSDQTIVGAASNTDVFQSLVAAVTAADPSIAQALSNPDAVFTVFAPTNEAFANLITALGASSLEDLVNQVGVEALSTILLYHVVDACAFSNDLEDGQELVTLQGETLEVDLANLAILDKTDDPSGLVVDLLDIRTANGVVHGINKVLLPDAIIR